MVSINPGYFALPRGGANKTQPNNPQYEVSQKLPKPGEGKEELLKKIKDHTSNLPKFKPDETLRNDQISDPNEEPKNFFA